jgi:hypothetical protein
MTAGRSRRRSAAYAALALALCGSLALTGCNSHSKSKKSKKHSYSSTSKSKKHKLAGAAGAGAGAGAASRRVPNCTTGTSGDFKFAPKTKSSPHLILTYRNTKSRPCRLNNAPMVYLGDASKPLGYYEGAPSFAHTHQIEVPAGGQAYASIPTPTAATKGTPQKVVKIFFMAPSDPESRGLSTTIHYDRYDFPPSIGKSAKVSDWYRSAREAELQTDTL